MKRVPGVMTLWSKVAARRGGSGCPRARSFSRSSASTSSRSRISCAALKRRERCWFILARGATPSMAMKSSLRGRTAARMRSM